MTNLLSEEIPYQQLKYQYFNLKNSNENLLDGLYYAAYVQQGLMPQARHFEKLNYPYFIIYQPLQIIGGDFFWLAKKGEWDLFAVGDCTGHGVSGAMLSALAIGFLNYLIYSKEFKHIGEILNLLDKKWIETFNSNFDDEIRFDNDWLSISLIAFNRNTRELQFAGAQNSILVVEDNMLNTLKGNSYPIGGWQIEKNRKYDTCFKMLREKSKIYLYSDGYKDQIGGIKNKRYGSQNFTQAILSIAVLDMHSQKNELISSFMSWKKSEDQTDDICIMSLEL